VNAEDPAKNFMPSPGHIGHYREPAGPGVRVDSGAHGDYDIPQAYDPMIAKVITYGADRDEARRRMLRALDEYLIEGIRTTIPFHRLMLADERFVTGEYHTGTVEKEMDLGVLKEDSGPKVRAGDPQIAIRNFEVEVDGKRLEVRIREHLELLSHPKKPKPPKSAAAVGGGGTDVLSAPMQGTIVKVLVKKGDEVKAGDTIVVLEAMKMENTIQAHSPGTVEEIAVEAGQSIETGGTIAVIR
jgi:acetyl-CoA/propionyl-CoA carboxylase biotin carboxyl carrier protein